MFRSVLRQGSLSRGFTLIELLVALAVLMIVLGAIGRLSASSLRAGGYVQRHVAEVEKVQQILAGLPERNELAQPGLAGETAGYRWRLDAAPFSADFIDPHAPTPWTPLSVVLTMQGPGGVPLSFNMVRLVRTSAK